MHGDQQQGQDGKGQEVEGGRGRRPGLSVRPPTSMRGGGMILEAFGKKIAGKMRKLWGNCGLLLENCGKLVENCGNCEKIVENCWEIAENLEIGGERLLMSIPCPAQHPPLHGGPLGTEHKVGVGEPPELDAAHREARGQAPLATREPLMVR